MERILDISDAAVRLSVRDDQLVIEHDNEKITTPISELAVLVLSQPAVILSQAVLSRIAEKGGSVVITGSDFQPSAMLLPLNVHSTQTERLAAQISCQQPLRKQLWKKIVSAKIRAQGRLLQELHGSDLGVIAMSQRVRSGDPENLEAQAARRYWPALFCNPKFRRGSEGPDENQFLNYGYAVLRSCVTRAICAAGLHPSVGLQHHNRYDSFCLSSDLMEPYRILVDRAVYHWVQAHDFKDPLGKDAKRAIISAVLGRHEWKGESRTVFDFISATAASLAKVYMKEEKELRIAEL